MTEPSSGMPVPPLNPGTGLNWNLGTKPAEDNFVGPGEITLGSVVVPGVCVGPGVCVVPGVCVTPVVGRLVIGVGRLGVGRLGVALEPF
jgi:hypothetical protein